MTSFVCRIRGHVWEYVDQMRTCDRCARREVGQLVEKAHQASLLLQPLLAQASSPTPPPTAQEGREEL